MYYGHSTCTMAIGHVLWPWDGRCSKKNSFFIPKKFFFVCQKDLFFLPKKFIFLKPLEFAERCTSFECDPAPSFHCFGWGFKLGPRGPRSADKSSKKISFFIPKKFLFIPKKFLFPKLSQIAERCLTLESQATHISHAKGMVEPRELWKPALRKDIPKKFVFLPKKFLSNSDSGYQYLT